MDYVMGALRVMGEGLCIVRHGFYSQIRVFSIICYTAFKEYLPPLLL